MIYERGIDSIPSESVCYPAKISHGHMESLIKMGCKFIFYPCIPYEKIEDAGAGNHYNCPVVAYYGEVLQANIEELKKLSLEFPAYINGERSDKRELEMRIDKIRRHLIKEHGYMAKGIQQSIGAAIGIVGGALLGLLLGFAIGKIKVCMLVCLAVGLTTGMIIGKIYENKKIKEGKIF